MKMLNYIFCLSLLITWWSCCVNAQSNNWGVIPGIFSYVRYQNTACENEHGDVGVCISESECKNKNHQIYRTCPTQTLVCCIAKFTCGQETSQNLTEFVNPSYPLSDNSSGTCRVKIEKPENVCQLRLDIDEFTLAQPDKTGACTTDSFMIRNSVGDRLPILCGDNSGQHIYIDLGDSKSNPISLTIISNGNNLNRKWKIRITLIACKDLASAPSGCFQYYRSPSGIIRSFNYGPENNETDSARYLSKLRYTSCIRVEENFCAIKWEPETPDSFNFGIPSNSIDDNSTVLYGRGKECNGDDFVTITEASLDGIESGHDRFCGKNLSYKNVLISRSKPFQIRIHSSENHTLNALHKQTGFSLRYVQLPCVV